MNKHFLSASIALLIASAASATVTVDFADQTLPASGHTTQTFGFTSRGATFNNTYQDFGTYRIWTGWALSNVNDTTTVDYEKDYTAVTGTDFGADANYAVAYTDATIDLPAGERAQSVRLTNTTYAAGSVRDGYLFARKFAAGDAFSVTFTGYSGAGATGGTVGAPVEFFLADFRDGKSTIVDTWELLDLTALGDARSIGITYATTDVSIFDGVAYPNTPTYVAIDNLQLVPEPATLAALGGVAIVALRRRRSGGR